MNNHSNDRKDAMSNNGHITLFEASQLADLTLNQGLVKSVLKDGIGIRDENGIIYVDLGTFENWVDKRRARGLGGTYTVPDGYVSIIAHLRKVLPPALHATLLGKGTNGTLSTDFLALLAGGALPTARKAGGPHSPWIARKAAIDTFLEERGYVATTR